MTAITVELSDEPEVLLAQLTMVEDALIQQGYNIVRVASYYYDREPGGEEPGPMFHPRVSLVPDKENVSRDHAFVDAIRGCT